VGSVGLLGASFLFGIPSTVILARDVTVTPIEVDLANWSGTHLVHTSRYYQPECADEIENVVRSCNVEKAPLRPVGSGLSPNGIGFNSSGMISLAQCDRVLSVDRNSGHVTVEAGIRVSQLVEELRHHGLTLQNYASIAEQQIGGFIQIGAHGTGATIPPVEEQVVGLSLVTPTRGVVHLTKEDGEEFHLAKLGLGCLGVVSTVTLQCVPMHKLREETRVVSRAEIRQHHAHWLTSNRHLRYMWIPLTDRIVVVTCNPVDESTELGRIPLDPRADAEALEPARALLRQFNIWSEDEINRLSFTQLRDRLLAVDPLNVSHVRAVNEVEATYWERSQGSRVDWSDRILGFDCGGQQWVSEVAFSTGNLNSPTFRDLDFMDDLLSVIEDESIAAPAPLEQRWSSSSRAPMSAAYSLDKDEVFSWVGIVAYLPTEEEIPSAQVETLRQQVTNHFVHYRQACENKLWPKFDVAEHWGKIEAPEDPAQLRNKRAQLAHRIAGIPSFLRLSEQWDPHHILMSSKLTSLLTPTKNK